MTYATISAIVLPGHEGTLDYAIACAARWSAHLDAICVTDEQLDAPVPVTPDLVMSGYMLAEPARDGLMALERRVRQRLSAETLPWSVSAPEQRGADFVRAVADAARFADLVVLPKPDGAARIGVDPAVEALLYMSRVPILATPVAEPAFERVLIGWDGSAVALAAIRAALPILIAAGTVEIVTVDPATATAGHDLAVMLGRHGVAADLAALPRGGRRVAEVFRAHAAERGADLAVMGAYGSRRLRDMLLGGVTREMLDTAPLPLFLAR